VRAPGSPAPLSIFFNSGATPRRIVRRRGARCIVRAPGGPASTRGPRLGTYCADVRLGASCVPREVQRFSLSLSLSQLRGHASANRAPSWSSALRAPREVQRQLWGHVSARTYCADVRLGASCVPREVQRQLGGHVSAPRTPTWGSAHRACSGKSSVSLSLSLSLNAGPTSRRIVRRRELSAPFVPRKAQRQLGAHASIGQRLRAALLKYITDEELFLKFRDYCRRSIPRPRSVHRSLLNVTSRASTPRAHTGSVLR